MSDQVNFFGPVRSLLKKSSFTSEIIFSAIMLVLFFLGYNMLLIDVQKNPPLKELTLTMEERQVRYLLSEHVRIVGEKIGERNIWRSEKLAETAEYIEKEWIDQGYEVKQQDYMAKKISVRNLEVEIKGELYPDDIIVVGAHYDSVRGSPGSNDNGSGVAAMLEVTRLFYNKKPARTVRFVAFVNEEPPFFLSRLMGSRVYAARCRERKENISAMLSIECVGFYSDSPKSQKYPFPFRYFYPDKANFIAFVGNLKSRSLLKNSLETFRIHASLPAHGLAAPGWMTGVGWSDHWSFWREGYKAFMVTDTALFRYEPYHLFNDTPEKLDYERMAKVTSGIYRLIGEMSGTVL